jgi:lactoylglutathione lyase
MQIAHVALWTADLERLVAFYVRYFGAVPGRKYDNPVRRFESYFLAFDGGARLELMRVPDLAARAAASGGEIEGPAHLAFATGSQEKVDALTEELRRDGHPIVGEPRTTGDGYYESVALDPDGNRIEITI